MLKVVTFLQKFYCFSLMLWNCFVSGDFIYLWVCFMPNWVLIQYNVSWFLIVYLVVARLLQVYLSLCCALIASAVGAYFHVLWNIGGLLTTIGCMATMAWLLATPPYEEVSICLVYVLLRLFSSFIIVYYVVARKELDFLLLMMCSKRGFHFWWQLDCLKELLLVLW